MTSKPITKEVKRHGFTFVDGNADALRRGHIVRVTNGEDRELTLHYGAYGYWVDCTLSVAENIGSTKQYDTLAEARRQFNFKLKQLATYYDIEGLYYGIWESLTRENTYCEAKERLNEYRLNSPGIPYRIVNRVSRKDNGK